MKIRRKDKDGKEGWISEGRIKMGRKDEDGKEVWRLEGRIMMARMKIGRKDENYKEEWIGWIWMMKEWWDGYEWWRRDRMDMNHIVWIGCEIKERIGWLGMMKNG